MSDCLWSDKKRTSFLGLPLSFTSYKLTNEKLLIDKGFFSRDFDEVRLYRILDVSLHQSLSQRLFGIGTIDVESSDKSMGNFQLVNVKNPKQVIELLSDIVEKVRSKKRVSTREFITDSDDFDDGGLDNE